jgi:hypothetical protein
VQDVKTIADQTTIPQAYLVCGHVRAASIQRKAGLIGLEDVSSPEGVSAWPAEKKFAYQSAVVSLGRDSDRTPWVACEPGDKKEEMTEEQETEESESE